jgi:hypothetical protein
LPSTGFNLSTSTTPVFLSLLPPKNALAATKVMPLHSLYLTMKLYKSLLAPNYALLKQVPLTSAPLTLAPPTWLEGSWHLPKPSRHLLMLLV